MTNKITYVWVCGRCGGNGETVVDEDWCSWGVHMILARSHSLQCPGCDGAAPSCLRFRTIAQTDQEWARTEAFCKRAAEERKRLVRYESPHFIA